MLSKLGSERIVFLHVGMHKTASTYIQKCLRKNIQLLRREGFITPESRKKNTALVRALTDGNIHQWNQWLKSAGQAGCQLLISHEALSLRLCEPVAGMNGPSGLWLADQLKTLGWRLRIIGFIRNQESYLNSRYTQLAKRLRVDCDFNTYVRKVMSGATISECNLMILFSWIKEDPSIMTSMIPFASARDQNGQVIQHKIDPFEQLISELDLTPQTIAGTQRTKVLNQQPGRIGVSLSKEICQFMQQHRPDALKTHRKKLSAAIEELAMRKKWGQEPFNGLTTQLSHDIREHYRLTNQQFCRSFWPNQKWEQIFPDIQEAESPVDIKDDEDNLRNLRDNVIKCTIPAVSMIQ